MRLSQAPLLLAGTLLLATVSSGCERDLMPPEPLGPEPQTEFQPPDDFVEPLHPGTPTEILEFEDQGLPGWHIGRAMVPVGSSSLAIADIDNNMVVEVSADTLAAHRKTIVDGGPERIVAMPNGDLWVTLRHSGELAHLDADRNIVKYSVLTEPYAIAAHPELPVIYVSGLVDGKVIAFDTDERAVVSTFGGIERPRGLAIKDGTLFVVTEAQGVMGIALGEAGSLRTASDSFNYRKHNPWMFRGLTRVAVRASQVTLDPRTGDLLVSHSIASPGDEDSMFDQAFMQMFLETEGLDEEFSEGGGGYGASNNSNDFGVPHHPLECTVTRVGGGLDSHTVPPVITSFVDVEPEQELSIEEAGTVVLHLLDQPMDIVHHPSLSVAFVAGFGSDTVVALSTATEDPAASPLAVWETGRAPKSLALSADGKQLFVLEAHDYSVSSIDLSDLNDWLEPSGAERAWHRQTPAGRTFGTDPLEPAVSRGRRVFTYSRSDALSQQHLFACASCHFDGREDQVVWAVADGPRQTPALAGRLAGTAPFNWMGSEHQLQDNMAQTVKRLGGHGLNLEDLGDLEAFMLKGLRPIPNPMVGLAKRGLNPTETFGKAIFHDPTVGCATCHAGEKTTDGMLHEVGTLTSIEKDLAQIAMSFGSTDENPAPIRYNTPTLAALHYTAPYLHDGSAPTLHDVLDMTSKTMGHTDQLLDHEKDALVAYLLTL